MYIIIIILPLISTIITSIYGSRIGIEGIKYITKILMIIIVIISSIIYWEIIGNNIIIKLELGKYIEMNEIISGYTIKYNKESIIMINLVMIISTIVQYYSIWYMKEDPHIIRFIIKIQIFTVMMSFFILSNNLICMFIGWEGIGILSYFLINFWFTRIQANKSALKAIFYNRVGDAGYILALIIIIYNTKNMDQENIWIIKENIEIIIISIIIACFTKSAQYLFHPWLASSMEGPTPVSALLHAATMVTAGVYLLLRYQIILLQSTLLWFYIIYTLITIIFSGLSSLYQSDIKKIIAFSTSAQLAYMFLALLTEVNGLYHLITHGFFKALLFLLAGIIIHSNFDNQDIRKTGSFIFNLPTNYSYSLIASFAIMAFPFLSGYYSKDVILENSFLHPIYIYILALFGSILTILYSIKIIYNVFYKTINLNSYYNISEHSFSIYFFLLPLLFGSIFLGFFFSDFFIGCGQFSNDFEYLSIYIKLLPTFILIIIILFTIKFFNIIFNKRLIQYFSLHLFLDSLVNNLFVNFYSFLSYHFFFKFIDRGFLEFIPISFYRFFSLFSFLPSYKDSFMDDNNFILFLYCFISFFFFFLLFLT